MRVRTPLRGYDSHVSQFLPIIEVIRHSTTGDPSLTRLPMWSQISPLMSAGYSMGIDEGMGELAQRKGAV